MLLVAFWGCAQFCTDWLHTAGARDISAICRAVGDSHILPSGTDVQYVPGLWQSDVLVYGVRDESTQNRVIEVVRAARNRLGAKPVKIEFRTEFTMRPNGSDTNVADTGELLRAEVVR